jgi:hypothetical protein
MSAKLLEAKILTIKIVSFLFFASIFMSCEKHMSFIQHENLGKNALTGDTAIFKGKWNWAFTDHDYGWCQNAQYYEVLDPTTENTSFFIEFFEAGYLNYYKNDTLVNNFRVSFQYFEFTNQLNCNHFAIDLDGFNDLSLSGCIKADTLKCYLPGFLFFAEAGCEQYVNYFVKE